MLSPQSAATQRIPGKSQAQPSSIEQLSLQPSPEELSPSSQVSSPVILLSPHSTVLTQGSPGVGQTTLSSSSQLAVQPSPDSPLPSSHVSPATLMRPSPQAGSGGGSSVPSHSPAASSHSLPEPAPSPPAPPSLGSMSMSFLRPPVPVSASRSVWSELPSSTISGELLQPAKAMEVRRPMVRLLLRVVRMILGMGILTRY